MEYIETSKKSNIINVNEANNIFLIGALVLFVYNILIRTGSIAYNVNSLTSIFLEVIFFLIPSVAYLLITKKDIKTVLRINKIHIKNIITIIGITIFSLPIIGTINYVVMYLQSLIGKPIPYNIPAIGSQEEMILGIIVIALTPAICEEVMCRGVLMKAYESYGKVSMILISAGLFAVLHRNIQTFAAIFFLGTVIGYITYRTNSIFGGIIAHFTNNIIAVVVSYFTNFKAEIDMDFEQIKLVDNISIEGIIAIITILCIFLLIFIVLIMLLKRNTKSTVKTIIVSSKKAEGIKNFIPLIIGLILISFEFINQVIYILFM